MAKAKTDIDWYKVIVEAKAAAVKAGQDFRQKYGEPFYCGFAWVNITPGTHPIIKVLREDFSGSIQGHKAKRGWDVWNPGGTGTQSMDIKEHEARAFADVLKKYGVVCYVDSRAD